MRVLSGACPGWHKPFVVRIDLEGLAYFTSLLEVLGI
jgi:hypothetical protein